MKRWWEMHERLTKPPQKYSHLSNCMYQQQAYPYKLLFPLLSGLFWVNTGLPRPLDEHQSNYFRAVRCTQQSPEESLPTFLSRIDHSPQVWHSFRREWISQWMTDWVKDRMNEWKYGWDGRVRVGSGWPGDRAARYVRPWAHKQHIIIIITANHWEWQSQVTSRQEMTITQADSKTSHPPPDHKILNIPSPKPVCHNRSCSKTLWPAADASTICTFLFTWYKLSRNSTRIQQDWFWWLLLVRYVRYVLCDKLIKYLLFISVLSDMVYT